MQSRSSGGTVGLGAAYTRAALVAPTGPSLDSPTGDLLQGAPISADGTWNPPAATAVAVNGPTVSLNVGASSAVLARAE